MTRHLSHLSRSDIRGECPFLPSGRRGLHGRIRTAGEPRESSKWATESGRVGGAVLRVHNHVDDGVHAGAGVQEYVAGYVEHWNYRIVMF